MKKFVPLLLIPISFVFPQISAHGISEPSGQSLVGQKKVIIFKDGMRAVGEVVARDGETLSFKEKIGAGGFAVLTYQWQDILRFEKFVEPSIEKRTETRISEKTAAENRSAVSAIQRKQGRFQSASAPRVYFDRSAEQGAGKKIEADRLNESIERLAGQTPPMGDTGVDEFASYKNDLDDLNAKMVSLKSLWSVGAGRLELFAKYYEKLKTPAGLFKKKYFDDQRFAAPNSSMRNLFFHFENIENDLKTLSFPVEKAGAKAGPKKVIPKEIRDRVMDHLVEILRFAVMAKSEIP
jgi:hypothetical protein